MSDRLRSLAHLLTIPAILAVVWFAAHMKGRSIKDVETTWREGDVTRRGNPFTAPFDLRLPQEPMTGPKLPTTTPAGPGEFAAVDADPAE